MSEHGPIEAALHGVMNGVAEVLEDVLPAGYGFALLAFKLNVAGPGHMNYISNAERADMIAALKELIANFEGRGHAPPPQVQ